MFDMLPLKMTRAEFEALPVVNTPQQELGKPVGFKYRTPRLPSDPHFAADAWWYAEIAHISSYGAKVVYRPVEFTDAALDEEAW